MRQFNVILWDINRRDFVPYDIIPYFVREYEYAVERKTEPKTTEEFKEFVVRWGRYQFWARCEYEIVLTDWPILKTQKKIDVFEQIKMNLDLIVELVMDSVKDIINE